MKARSFALLTLTLVADLLGLAAASEQKLGFHLL